MTYDKPRLLDVETLKPPCMPTPSIDIRKNADGSVTCGASIDINSIATEYARYIGKTLDAEVLRVLEVICRNCLLIFCNRNRYVLLLLLNRLLMLGLLKSK